jgi:hypothetical protein
MIQQNFQQNFIATSMKFFFFDVFSSPRQRQWELLPPITTNFASSNPTQAIQHYVIKFARKVFFSRYFGIENSTNKTDRHDITET